ncbi:MAG TPA: hypothetical protein VMG39_17305 [Pseudolabrys sp.]|nr:hypothetical protein [Pseudolabrys sp.]
MSEQLHTAGDNVVPWATKLRIDMAAGAAPFIAGGQDDPRTREAIRLIESFLAIEDASARAALIALAESLVTHDWLRRAQQR